MKKIIFITFLCISWLILFSGYALSVPSEPPPDGKVWVEVGGEWILVVAPPGDGPYSWREGKWVIDPTPPPHGSEWVPGYWVPRHRGPGGRWVPGHWVSAHWEGVESPGPGVKWVPGHWKAGKWLPGNWAGSPPIGRHWVPGRRGPAGRWIPGHWR